MNERIAVEAMKLGAKDYIVKDEEGRYLELLLRVYLISYLPRIFG